MSGSAPAPYLARLPDTGPLAPARPDPHLVEAPVLSNVPLTADYWRLTLASPEIAAAAQPGQFVMLTIANPEDPAPVLPRPMAIYGWDRTGGTFDIVYRIVGDGTRRLAAWRPGRPMVVVGPLGRGFTLPDRRGPVLVLGRGIGTCSLTALAGEATARGFQVHAVASARNRGALVGHEAYRAAGAAQIIEAVDEDGSSAPERLRERLTALSDEGLAAVYACGSNRLLALGADLAAANRAEVQVSLEAHMACGLGFCHGCAAGRPGLPRETPLVCADGPVFRYLALGAEGR
jgi:dihydroorotate dehydrogenase electron transfer subunit